MFKSKAWQDINSTWYYDILGPADEWIITLNEGQEDQVEVLLKYLNN